MSTHSLGPNGETVVQHANGDVSVVNHTGDYVYLDKDEAYALFLVLANQFVRIGDDA